MLSILTTLVDRLDSDSVDRDSVITWGAPVPSFGDITRAHLATVGLNPSSREFVDPHGRELMGHRRRFHTLRSLNLNSWLDVDARHLESILDTCCKYFHTNPYDRWFRRLDGIISKTPVSLYPPIESACHLDLIPYATKVKWTELSSHDRQLLLMTAGDTLGRLLRDSPVRMLVLNGSSVVQHFERIGEVRLKRDFMPSWMLPRRRGNGVPGVAYEGTVSQIGGVMLGRTLVVLGYNHNPQSSFGVTNAVLRRIREWIAQRSAVVFS